MKLRSMRWASMWSTIQMTAIDWAPGCEDGHRVDHLRCPVHRCESMYVNGDDGEIFGRNGSGWLVEAVCG